VTPPQIPITLNTTSGTGGSIGIVGVAVDPQNPSIVYTSGQSKNGYGSVGIFKSTDCGSTWNKINTGRNGAMLDSGSQWYGGILIDPTNTQVMYAESGYGAGGIFKSTNGGVDWDQLLPSTSPVAMAIPNDALQDTAMDPADPKHLVGSTHANCTAPHSPNCFIESKDAGMTWHIFNGPSSVNGWLEGAGVVILGPSTFLYGTLFNGLFYTNNDGSSWTQVHGSGGFQMYTAANGTMYLPAADGILKSTDGMNWTKIPNSPKATQIIGDGVNMYSSFTNDYSGKPFWTAPESDPSSWTNVNTPMLTQGATWLAYDRYHHILYSADMNAGLYRVVTLAGGTNPGDGGNDAASSDAATTQD
jgi:hypothetical protein